MFNANLPSVKAGPQPGGSEAPPPFPPVSGLKPTASFVASLVQSLEQLCAVDQDLAKSLILKRAACASTLLDDKVEAQVVAKEGKRQLSVLGFLNGLASAEGKVIQALYDEHGTLIGFRSVSA